jgi:hypothetical protein
VIRALLLIPLFAGCLSALGPEVGAPVVIPCNDVDSDPSVDVKFSADILAPILDGAGHCTHCHSPTGMSPIGYADTGLDVSTYSTLMAGGTRSASSIVIAGKPCESVLVQKLGASPPFGARMPLDGPPYLTAAEIQTIHDWIAEGASNN